MLEKEVTPWELQDVDTRADAGHLLAYLEGLDK